MKVIHTIRLFVLTFLLVVPMTVSFAATSPSIKKIDAIIRSVTDGDTVVVSTGNDELKVRLLYIDAMEKSYNAKMRRDIRDLESHGVHVRKNDLVALGKLAKIYLASILREKDPVTLEIVVGREKDRYHRTLAVIYKKELNINLLMVQSGYARAYFVGKTPETVRKTYRQAEDNARTANRVIWKYLKTAN
jgi:endonuclease YncB( thermonuclease family)